MPRYVEYEATQSVDVAHLPNRPRMARGDHILIRDSMATTIAAFYCGILVHRGEHDVPQSRSLGTHQLLPRTATNQGATAANISLPSDPPEAKDDAPQATTPPRARNRSMAGKTAGKVKTT